MTKYVERYRLLLYSSLMDYFFIHCNCRAHILDLAVSLLPGLDVEGVDLLFDAIKPALKVSIFLYY